LFLLIFPLIPIVARLRARQAGVRSNPSAVSFVLLGVLGGLGGKLFLKF